MRHLMSPLDLTVEELDQLLDLAQDIEANPKKYAHACDGKKLATLFYEPSTRTRLSHEAAMLNLGGSVLAGDLMGIGAHGYYWSSTAYSNASGAYYLSSNVGGINSANFTNSVSDSLYALDLINLCRFSSKEVKIERSCSKFDSPLGSKHFVTSLVNSIMQSIGRNPSHPFCLDTEYICSAASRITVSCLYVSLEWLSVISRISLIEGVK